MISKGFTESDLPGEHHSRAGRHVLYTPTHKPEDDEAAVTRLYELKLVKLERE